MFKVSIIIICFNGGKYLPETIASVQGQTLTNWEIILVDDGSTDQDTIGVIDSLASEQIKIFHKSHQGLPESRNYGVRQSSGQYILQLDCDDLLNPDFLLKTTQILDSNRSIDIVYTDYKKFGLGDCDLKLPDFSVARLLVGSYFLNSSMQRRMVFDQVGGYDQHFILTLEDWDYWLSALERGCNFFHLPEILFSYRQRPDSVTNSISGFKQEAPYFGLAVSKHKQLYLKEFFKVLNGYREYYFQQLRLLEDSGGSKIRLTGHIVKRVLFLGYYLLKGDR